MRSFARVVPALVLAILVPPLAAAGPLPRPESVFGFKPGADNKLATYDQTIDYLQKPGGRQPLPPARGGRHDDPGPDRCTSRSSPARPTSRGSTAFARLPSGWRTRRA